MLYKNGLEPKRNYGMEEKNNEKFDFSRYGFDIEWMCNK